MRILFLAALFLSLASCGHYRRSSNGYRGVGEYKTADSYSPEISRKLASDGLNTRGFTPSRPFQLVWPVHRIKVNRGFKPAHAPKHQGLDLGGSRGTHIVSAHEGMVIYAGNEFRGYGNMVLIEYGEEWASLYAHLDRIDVRNGDFVVPGQKLGTMGRTGVATGVHLHFELLHNRQPIDPLPYLTRGQRFANSER